MSQETESILFQTISVISLAKEQFIFRFKPDFCDVSLSAGIRCEFDKACLKRKISGKPIVISRKLANYTVI